MNNEKAYLIITMLYITVMLGSIACNSGTPPGNSTEHTHLSDQFLYNWSFSNYVEKHYIQRSVKDYAIITLPKNSIAYSSKKYEEEAYRNAMLLDLVLFEQENYTQLYIFYSTPFHVSSIHTYTNSLLDTIRCYKEVSTSKLKKLLSKEETGVLDAYEQFREAPHIFSADKERSDCILSILDIRLEKDFYSRYADTLWQVPVGLSPDSIRYSFNTFYLNQFRNGKRRLAYFSGMDLTRHPILEKLIIDVKAKAVVKEQFARLFPDTSDYKRFRRERIFGTPWFWFIEKSEYVTKEHPTLGKVRGVFDRTLREVHHFTGYNKPSERDESYVVGDPIQVVRSINKLIYTKPRTLILPDSFRLLQNLDTLVISADARVPEQLDIILSLKKLRWLVFWQPYTAAEIRDVIAEMETQNLPALQEVWFSCTDCYLENNADGVVETQNLASLPPRYVIKDYQAMRRKFGLIE